MVSMIIKVLKNLVSRPFTTSYPKGKARVSINFRGTIHVDQKKCIACKLCEVNCPTGAIVVDPKRKYSVVDRGRCILCGMCAEACPVNVIWFSKDFENATTKKSSLAKQLPGPNPRPGRRS